MNIAYIEQTVCDCVNDTLSALLADYDKVVVCEDLYNGTTKVTLCVSLARHFCYYVLHDMYHQPYSTIALMANCSTRSVIGGVNKVRELTENDDLYCGILSLLRERL